MRSPFDPIPVRPDRGHWTEDALCAQSGMYDAWFPSPTDREGETYARKICAQCPVKAACEEAGAEEEFGIWGGKPFNQRRTERRQAQPGGPRPFRHGSTSGARTHRARGEAPCEACITAERRYNLDRQRRRAS